jgi:hypothetical protein
MPTATRVTSHPGRPGQTLMRLLAVTDATLGTDSYESSPGRVASRLFGHRELDGRSFVPFDVADANGHHHERVDLGDPAKKERPPTSNLVAGELLGVARGVGADVGGSREPGVGRGTFTVVCRKDARVLSLRLQRWPPRLRSTSGALEYPEMLRI